MQKKFVCVLAIFALVAAMTFSEADACRRCNYDGCSGCQQSCISVATVPSYSVCNGCDGHYSGPSYLPKQYCGGCLRRKSLRLVDNCNCGC